MNPNTFSKLRFLLIALLLMPAGHLAYSQYEGTVKVDSITDVTPVVARSENSNTLKLMQAAFDIHGAFTLVDSPREASFAVTIEPIGGAGARLSIASGVPEQTLFTETLTGSGSEEAALRAIDRAIFKMRGTPGFFAGKLTYIGEQTGFPEVYTSDLFFQRVTRLTSDRVNAVRPRWSPDGNYIVYTSYKSGFPDIYRLDLRANSREVVADYEGMNMGARYSPDGQRLALIISGGSNPDLWVRESGGGMRKLTRSSGLEAAPAWSPDGTRIVFSSDQSGGVQLFVVPSQGGTMRRLRTDISGYCAEPDWNPLDPNQIAFTAAQGSGYQIALYDTAKGGSRFLTSERGDAIEPHWMSDGRHLVYTHRRANNSEIKILDTLTGSDYALSGGLGKVSQASFLAPR